MLLGASLFFYTLKVRKLRGKLVDLHIINHIMLLPRMKIMMRVVMIIQYKEMFINKTCTKREELPVLIVGTILTFQKSFALIAEKQYPRNL